MCGVLMGYGCGAGGGDADGVRWRECVGAYLHILPAFNCDRLIIGLMWHSPDEILIVRCVYFKTVSLLCLMMFFCFLKQTFIAVQISLNATYVANIICVSVS